MQPSQEKNATKSIYKNSTQQSQLLEIVRNFNVPVEELFKAFTTPEVLKIWWWPKDLHSDEIKLDFREGGKYFINMKGYDQGGGGMTGHFEEIIDNKLIVMTDQFSDARGQAMTAKQANMPGHWPELVYITFDFASLGESSSRFKLSQQGIPNELQKDCKLGWSESFDKLKAYLENKN